MREQDVRARRLAARQVEARRELRVVCARETNGGADPAHDVIPWRTEWRCLQALSSRRTVSGGKR